MFTQKTTSECRAKAHTVRYYIWISVSKRVSLHELENTEAKTVIGWITASKSVWTS